RGSCRTTDGALVRRARTGLEVIAGRPGSGRSDRDPGPDRAARSTTMNRTIIIVVLMPCSRELCDRPASHGDARGPDVQRCTGPALAAGTAALFMAALARRATITR